MAVQECYHRELSQVEWMLEKQAKQHQPTHYYLLKTIPGIDRILALTILYEIGDIERFESVQKFVSYSKLIKCKAESAGKVYGTQGNKIGNAYLKRGILLGRRALPSCKPWRSTAATTISKAHELSQSVVCGGTQIRPRSFLHVET